MIVTTQIKPDEIAGNYLLDPFGQPLAFIDIDACGVRLIPDAEDDANVCYSLDVKYHSCSSNPTGRRILE